MGHKTEHIYSSNLKNVYIKPLRIKRQLVLWTGSDIYCRTPKLPRTVTSSV